MATYHHTAYEQLSFNEPELYHDLLEWVRFGRCNNNLLWAAIKNNFEEVMCYRDHENLDGLTSLAKTLYNYVPSCAWKNLDNIKIWAKERQEKPWPEFEFGKML